MDLATTVGLVGFVCLFGAFALNLVGRLDRTGGAYLAMNAVGAAILAWYGLQKDTPIFVALEGIWSLAAVVTLFLWLRRRFMRQGIAQERVP
jgi:fucose permease